MTTTEIRLDGWRLVIDVGCTFVARGAATLMTLTQSGFPTDARRDEHTLGLPVGFDNLELRRGDRDVMMHGADPAREALRAGVLDAIDIQLRPVLLGQARRLFDGLPAEHIELELVRTLEAPGVLHLRYDVHRL